MATGQIHLTGTAQKIVGARSGRKDFRIWLSSTDYVGPDNTVSSSTGMKGSNTSTAPFSFPTEGEVWGSGSSTVVWVEIYDDGL